MDFQDRFLLLNSLVALIPPTSLHVIPSVITEAVLGTKEPSEKARNAAFDLIVTMLWGQKRIRLVAQLVILGPVSGKNNVLADQKFATWRHSCRKVA